MASTLVKETARRILRELRAQREGVTKEVLCQRLGVSPPSIQRAMTWLRDECDSPLEFMRPHNAWVLKDPHFTLSLSDPDPADLAAVMFAEALLAPIADEEITARIRRLVEQMDSEIRAHAPEKTPSPTKSVIATATTGTPHDSSVLGTLLSSVRRAVVQIEYVRVWGESEPQERSASYAVEPWQLRVHDGQLYLRAFSRHHREARTFRIAQIDSAVVLGDAPSAPVPPLEEIWGERDPAFGIDHDRPGTAVVCLRGPVARWVARTVWDESQRDAWRDTDGSPILERRLGFSSVRELARRLLGLGEGIVSIEPPRLREAIVNEARALIENLTP